MSVPRVYVGVDVAKAALEAARPGWANLSVPNTPAGHRLLLAWLAKITGAVQVVLEATGGYEQAVVDALHQAGVTLSVVNPRCAHNFAKAQNRLAKTDALDALGLADFGAKMRPAPTRPHRPSSGNWPNSSFCAASCSAWKTRWPTISSTAPARSRASIVWTSGAP